MRHLQYSQQKRVGAAAAVRADPEIIPAPRACAPQDHCARIIIRAIIAHAYVAEGAQVCYAMARHGARVDSGLFIDTSASCIEKQAQRGR